MYLMVVLAFIYIELQVVPLILSPLPSLVLLRNIQFLLQQKKVALYLSRMVQVK